MVLLAGASIVAALLLMALGQDGAVAWLAVVVIGFVVLITLVDMVRELVAGHWGLDILAVIAMLATVAVGEYLAGLIIVLMLAGGEALEEMAQARAGRELGALINRAPTFANRVDINALDDAESVQRLPIADVHVGDVLVVRPSEVVPVDGVLLSDRAVIDESSVTGEPVPVERGSGEAVTSGTVNGNEALQMRATTTASESQYATIVSLAQEAVASRAPMVRLADRYAVPFTVVSLLIAGIAWYVSGDPVRFAEVLVVATPCPLLIAAPVAFMGGMSSAARANVIVKDGGTLETLARVRSAAFDKTGTLTGGHPTVVRIRSMGRPEQTILGLAAASEQYSTHVFADPIIAHAREQGLDLPMVSDALEVATNGVRATLADRTEVRVGKPGFIAERVGPFDSEDLGPGESAAYVSRDSELLGVTVLSDAVRPAAKLTIQYLRNHGVEDIFMVTGDVRSTADSIAGEVGITQVYADATPRDKLELVRGRGSAPVMMVGDGINDAPVLAAADVGIAMGARGATAASESASAVITSENVARLADVMHISRRTIHIAGQSIWIGIVISVGLMLVAAFGYLPALAGALLQELVDLVAILSALRALALHRKLPSEHLAKEMTQPAPDPIITVAGEATKGSP